MLVFPLSHTEGSVGRDESGNEASEKKPSAAVVPGGGGVAASESSTPSKSEQLIQMYRHSVDVSADVLRSIEEVCTGLNFCYSLVRQKIHKS